MKKRKENDIPLAMLQNQEPAKKRSKLVLPEPQISEQELQQVVKLGRASEVAKEVASESGIETTDALLADYSITPQVSAMTPRTPAPITDRIMQEAQNIMALTHVETPLKGGLNTPLHETDFSGALPKQQAAQTPNTVIATPFRSTRTEGGVGGSTPGFLTPASGTVVPVGGQSIGQVTPLVRDKLNINLDDALEVGSTPAAFKYYQKQVKSSLKEGLALLPTPKNDYEIVVPENENQEAGENIEKRDVVEDQADVDARHVAEVKAKRARELALRSQVIQRILPRPQDINMTVLRPNSEMQGLNDLQKAEELVKQEMITMLHYDALHDPVPSFNPNKKTTNAPHLQYLEHNPYRPSDAEAMKVAKELLEEEMQIVKLGMAHGDLSLESYTQVWEECLSQVLYLPSQNRYTRANLASKKDRIESAEKRLEQNRKHMAKQAKQCGKVEKRLKIITGGYQARNQALQKQFLETCEQIEQSHLALSTFKYLAAQEDQAIPKRIQALTDDVDRQMEREKVLQAKYATLKEELDALGNKQDEQEPIEVPTSE